MNQKSRKPYLELLKKTLTFALWPEPPAPISTFNSGRSPLKRALVSLVSRMCSGTQYQIVRYRNFSESQRTEGQIWPLYADTMVGLKRLDNLQHCVEIVLRENIEGDLIETGVWRGGACIFMRAVLLAHDVDDRKVFVADSFEGLPGPDTEAHPLDEGDQLHCHDVLAVSLAEVQENFRKYDLLDDQVVFLKGWFKDTLPCAPIRKLSVLRLDGDMYGSTMDVLENLYPRLSAGGFCIIDDYALAGCRAAVNDYRNRHGIRSELKTIDWTGSYWRKEAGG